MADSDRIITDMLVEHRERLDQIDKALERHHRHLKDIFLLIEIQQRRIEELKELLAELKC